jgi:hypothetical protein
MLCNPICQLVSKNSTDASPAERADEKRKQSDFLPPALGHNESIEPQSRYYSKEATTIRCRVNQRNVGRDSPESRRCEQQNTDDDA